MTPGHLFARLGSALLLLALSAGFIVVSYDYSEASRELPLLVAYTTVVLLLLEIAARTRTGGGRAIHRFFNGDTEMPGDRAPARPNVREITAVLWLTAFMGAVTLFGFYWVVPVYVFGFLRLHARISVLIAAAVAGGLLLFLWVLFEVFLGYELFPGFLFGGI